MYCVVFLSHLLDWYDIIPASGLSLNTTCFSFLSETLSISILCWRASRTERSVPLTAMDPGSDSAKLMIAKGLKFPSRDMFSLLRNCTLCLVHGNNLSTTVVISTIHHVIHSFIGLAFPTVTIRRASSSCIHFLSTSQPRTANLLSYLC